MTTRRLKRLKQLATGTALVASTLSAAGDPPKPDSPKTPIRVNAPHDEAPTINAPPPAPEPPSRDAGVTTQPLRLNSPGPRAPVDAGVTEPKPEEPRVPVRINSTPRQPPKK